MYLLRFEALNQAKERVQAEKDALLEGLKQDHEALKQDHEALKAALRAAVEELKQALAAM